MNRCGECRKFCKWEELQLTEFVPDHEDGSGNHPEYGEYTCDVCVNAKNAYETAATESK